MCIHNILQNKPRHCRVILLRVLKIPCHRSTRPFVSKNTERRLIRKDSTLQQIFSAVRVFCISLKTLWTIRCFLDVLSPWVPLGTRESCVLADQKYRYREAFLQQQSRSARCYDLVLMGDSHVAAVDDAALWPGIATLNLGVARDTSRGLLNRLGRMASYPQSRIIVIAIGYNDLKYRTTEQSAANIEQIIKLVRSKWPRETVLLVQGVFPVTGKRRYANRRIDALNQHLRKLCTRLDCGYFDNGRYLTLAGSGLDPRYTEDGVHLNATGRMLWIKHLRGQLKL